MVLDRLFPGNRTGNRVKRDNVCIDGADEHLVLVQRDATICWV